MMLVSVHESSCVTPGITSNRIFRPIIRTGWIVHAPTDALARPTPLYTQADLPFALTHCELRLGRADWSASCSWDSGGSWYMILLDLRRRPVFVELMLVLYEEESIEGSLASAVNEIDL